MRAHVIVAAMLAVLGTFGRCADARGAPASGVGAPTQSPSLLLVRATISARSILLADKCQARSILL